MKIELTKTEIKTLKQVIEHYIKCTGFNGGIVEDEVWSIQEKLEIK